MRTPQTVREAVRTWWKGLQWLGWEQRWSQPVSWVHDSHLMLNSAAVNYTCCVASRAPNRKVLWALGLCSSARFQSIRWTTMFDYIRFYCGRFLCADIFSKERWDITSRGSAFTHTISTTPSVCSPLNYLDNCGRNEQYYYNYDMVEKRTCVNALDRIAWNQESKGSLSWTQWRIQNLNLGGGEFFLNFGDLFTLLLVITL